MDAMLDLEYCYQLIETMMNSAVIPLCRADVQHVLSFHTLCGYAVAENQSLEKACKKLVAEIPSGCTFGLLAIHAFDSALLADIDLGLEPFRVTDCQIFPCVLVDQKKTYRVEIVLFEESKTSHSE